VGFGGHINVASGRDPGLRQIKVAGD